MSTILERARRTIALECQALQTLQQKIGAEFEQAVELMQQCRSKVVVCGIGKSGHIGQKMAATFASTGTPSFFLHAAEACHGDLGMVSSDDLMLLISYSGNAQELAQLYNSIEKIGCKTIAITGNDSSQLAQFCDVTLNIHVEKEACPLELAPTTSSTVTLALGDALAMSLLEINKFSRNEFAKFHPQGNLGKQLLLKVKQLMKTGKAIPKITQNHTVADAILEMSTKSLGMTSIVNDLDQLCGIFTDGDLRRAMAESNFLTTRITNYMTLKPITIDAEELAINALRIMDTHKIQHLVVVNSEKHIAGLVHIYDITQQGLQL